MKLGALFEKVEKIKMPIRIAIFAGTLVILAVAFWYFVYDPYSTDIAQTEQKIASLQTEINKAKARARDLTRFQSEFDQVDAQFQEALLNYQNTVLTAQREVEDGLVAFAKQQEAVKFLEKAAAAARDWFAGTGA